MLGWHIGVHRQADGGGSPGKSDSRLAARLAVWQTGIGGLSWIDALVKEGRITDLGGNGYPMRYTAQISELAQTLLDGPPEARATWGAGPNDILTAAWAGTTVIDRATIESCRSEEWVIVEAWDES